MNVPAHSETKDTVAVIIVNYRTPELAIAAVESVRAFSHVGIRVSIHLLDNASPGDDAQLIALAHAERRWGEDVVLYTETTNLGFGGGNNVVLNALDGATCPPNKVFLLNPDAELRSEAIEILAKALDANPKAGAAGAALEDGAGHPMAGAFRFPSSSGELIRVANFGPLERFFPNRRPPMPADLPAGPVDWVSGAAVMFRFDALRETGFFDPGFFLYYEEVELMLRLSRHDWTTIYVPDAKVAHIEGASTGRGKNGRKRQADYIYQSWCHYFSIAKGRYGALFLALLMFPAALINILHKRARGAEPNIPKQFLSDHWRLVVRPLLGMSAKT